MLVHRGEVNYEDPLIVKPNNKPSDVNVLKQSEYDTERVVSVVSLISSSHG